MTLDSSVKELDEIRVGVNRAIVARVYSEHEVEVVYLDQKNNAINEDVVMVDSVWTFKNDGPCGGYADKMDRLKYAVSKLRHL